MPANARFGILAQRLASMPGIKAVGTFGGGGADEYQIEGQPAPLKLSRLNCGVEESDIFHAMRIPLQAGRSFNRSDTRQAAGAAIVNESMARVCWLGQSAVGKRFSRRAGTQEAKLYEVIAVVGDVQLDHYDQPVQPTFYEPFKSDSASSFRIFVVRGRGNPDAVVPTIREALKDVEPGMRTPIVGLCAKHLYDSTQLQRTYMLWLLALGGIGLVLAALGIYGVLAYSVVRRTREFGLRIALGAKQRDVVAMVMGQGARQIGLGVAAGVIAAFWLTRLLRHELFQVTAFDPVAFLGAVLLLSAIALTACFLPARRAARISPMEALRHE
jgi:putative ABC transport system permease protein